MCFSIVGDTVIDESLCRPEAYCDRPHPETCLHAEILYDPAYHKDDRVRTLEHNDNFCIPSPQIARACWRLLSECIEHRKADEEAAFVVKWGTIVFNIVELNTVKELARELQRCKVNVKSEEEFLSTGKNHSVPPGLVRIDDEDDDIFLAKFRILKNKLTLKSDIPLSTIQRTMRDYVDLDNEQIFNFSSPSRQLTEEDLHLILEIGNNQSDMKDVFIVYTPDLVDEEQYVNYIVKKGCKTANMIHVVVNINPAKGIVNTTEQNGHWVYCCIRNEKEILYGDPMGSRIIPTNIRAVLNPIYLEKYGRQITMRDVRIKNCSQQPNFPRQTCSTICGLVAVILCLSSFSEDLYNEIFFSQKDNLDLEMIRRPSFYSSQIRMRFLKMVISRKHCVQSFVAPTIAYSYKKGEEQLGSSYSMRTSKSNAPNAWASLKSKPRISHAQNPTKKAGLPYSTSKPSMPSVAAPSTQFLPDTGSTVAEENVLSAPSASHAASKEDRSSHQERVKLVKSSFIGLTGFETAIGYPMNDGHKWRLGGHKGKGNKKFVCSFKDCTALKHIFKTKSELRKKSKDPKCSINVNYMTAHCCNQEPKLEKSVESVVSKRN